MTMSGIFGKAGESKGGGAERAGSNGNTRDARSRDGKHVAVDDSPHTNATRRGTDDYEPKHRAK
jgi:hypothetical protein